MTWKGRMLAGIGERLRELGLSDLIEVTGFTESFDADIFTTFFYRNRLNEDGLYLYHGSFSDFVRGVK